MRRVIVAALAALLLNAVLMGAALGAEAPGYLRREISAMQSVPKGTWFALSKANFKLFVMKDSEVTEVFNVAVGKNRGQKQRVGDNRTPEGMFRIIQIQDSSYWTHDFRDGKGEIKGAYGSWFIRLETGWKGIGIHGTHDPASIGTNATEGCIRLANDDLRTLKGQYVKIGVNVYIFQ